MGALERIQKVSGPSFDASPLHHRVSADRDRSRGSHSQQEDDDQAKNTDIIELHDEVAEAPQAIPAPSSPLPDEESGHFDLSA
jgi:hypothetical protein